MGEECSNDILNATDWFVWNTQQRAGTLAQHAAAFLKYHATAAEHYVTIPQQCTSDNVSLVHSSRRCTDEPRPGEARGVVDPSVLQLAETYCFSSTGDRINETLLEKLKKRYPCVWCPSVFCATININISVVWLNAVDPSHSYIICFPGISRWARRSAR